MEFEGGHEDEDGDYDEAEDSSAPVSCLFVEGEFGIAEFLPEVFECVCAYECCNEETDHFNTR